jgi:hypothetical protein
MRPRATFSIDMASIIAIIGSMRPAYRLLTLLAAIALVEILFALFGPYLDAYLRVLTAHWAWHSGGWFQAGLQLAYEGFRDVARPLVIAAYAAVAWILFVRCPSDAAATD